MKKVRRLACWGTPLVLAGALAALCLARPPSVSGSLLDLVGEAAAKIPRFLREASAGEVTLVVSSSDAEAARKAAARLAEGGAAPASGRARDGSGEVKRQGTAIEVGRQGAAIDFLREVRGGLVAPETAALLATAEGRAKVARRAMRRLYASPLPPVLGHADDPFGLTDGFLVTLPAGAGFGTGQSEIRTNGVTRILVRRRLDEAAVADLDKTIDAVAALKREASCDPSVRVALSGSPVHTAVAAARSRREIGALTWFSLVVIAALGLFAFRSWRWLPLLASSLVVAALAGGLALVAGFRTVHLMTVVFGTTVLGLVIDYSFHWLLSPAEAKPTVVRGLLVSFATTEISLAPLMLSSIAVLRQAAVFLGVGLAAALAYVLAAYPRETDLRARTTARDGGLRCERAPWRRWGALMLVVLAVVAAAGLARVKVGTGASALYRPPAALAEAERLRALFGTFDFARLPSYEMRMTNAAHVAALYAEQGAALSKALGGVALVPPPAPSPSLVAPQKLLEATFADWTREAVRRLVFALVLMLAALVVFCRARALRLFAPSLFALAVAAGGLGLAGEPVNLFHLLAGFLLAGMSVDYTVFLHGGGRAAFKPAVCSLLTSMAGFGALAFVSFPVVRSFGVVLGLGLPVAFLAAWTTRPRTVSGKGSDPLPERTEFGASSWGMELLFALYRIFGLRVLHLLAAGVGLCVWACSPTVRRKTASWRKVVLFTRSLADKLVVLAEGRRLPHVETDGSDEAAAFVDDVRCGKGVFVLSSHVGTVEVLTALGACERTFHAWMDFDRTGVFNRFYLRHARRKRVVLHPISEFGMQTVFEAGDLLDAGDCLVMAGDRGDGAFRFAAAFDHPVYFVACIAGCGCRYRAVIRRLPTERKAMKNSYETIRAELAAAHPDQRFDWLVL